MSNISNSIPSQDEFMENHLHASLPPNEKGARCSICFVEWTEDGLTVVRININHITPCFYHRDCIATWFQAVGQNRWTCPDHRIELFEPAPVQEPEWTPQTVVPFINGHPFIHDSPEDLYQYAEFVLLRLEQRTTETLQSDRDTNMSRHGYQRVHDLQLAAAMRGRQNQNAQFYELANNIASMTEEYDREFMNYMPGRIRNFLSSASNLRNSVPSFEDRVPDFYDDVVAEINDRTDFLPDLTLVDSVIISDFFHLAMDLSLYTSHFALANAKRSSRPTQEDVDREIRLRGLVEVLEDDHQPSFPGYTAGTNVIADDELYAFTVSRIYEFALGSVEDHEDLAADTSERTSTRMGYFLSDWGSARLDQLQYASVLSGHQHLDPEFLVMSQLLRSRIRDADALFRDRVPAVIEAAITSDEELGLGWNYRQLALKNEWRDLPDVSAESILNLTRMCAEALEIQAHIKHCVRARARALAQM